jgi:membrane protein DedA with SNARE-associated domain/rhodanese-related sulfurtransferase
MNGIGALALRHGYAALFFYVLVSQLGFPLPSVPLLLAAGALAAAGQLGLVPVVLVAVMAALCADSAWFAFGRVRGAQVVRLLCRISLEPMACARIADGALARHGERFLLASKFLPGLGLMTAPTLGHSRVPYVRFIAFDGLGVSIWAATYVGAGCLLGETLERTARASKLAVQFGGPMVAVLLVVAVGVGVIRRRRLSRSQSAMRITARELLRRIQDGDAPYIVDLRDPVHPGSGQRSLPGAVHLQPADVLARVASISPDRDVVLVCDCPADAGSIEVARRLRRMGVGRAVALEGGFDGWRRGGFPLVESTRSHPSRSGAYGDAETRPAHVSSDA